MTKFETKQFGKILEAEAAGLRRALQNRRGVAVEFVSEECEQMTMAAQRELALEFCERTSRRLRDVEAALRRIETNDFGICVDCDEPIPAPRLTAIPWATRCVGCQETADRQDGRNGTFWTSSPHGQPAFFKVDPEETMKHTQLAVTALLAAPGSFSNREEHR